MQTLRNSPALVVALVALVMSTVGTSIAAAPLLGRDSVGAAQLRTGAVSSAEIRNRSITLPDLAYPTIGALRKPTGAAGGALGGTYPSPTIAAGAVTASALADGAVTGTKIGDGSIGGSDLADGSIVGSKIMSGSIGEDDLVAEENWHVIGNAGEAAFNPGWGSSALGLYEQASYRIDRFGTVHLRGAAWKGSDTGASYMFTLPAGYRPLKHRQFAVASFASTIGVLDVESSGKVWVSTSTNDNHVSLDGISFDAEQ